MHTGTLRVPGANLYYETRGSGPLLLLIPGGNGDAGFYAPLAKAAADRYTVVAYDRRGFSHSSAEGRLEDERRLEADVDDARRLLDHLADETAYVFGSSAGAIVALEFLIRHPEPIRRLVVHEPPAVRLLPDGERYVRFFDEVRDLYRGRGVRAAMRTFSAGTGAGPPRFGTREFWRLAPMLPRIRRNLKFSLEHQMSQYTRYLPDVDALKARSGRLVLAGGRESRHLLPYRPNEVLAERIGTSVIDFPGNHVGYRTHPAAFAAQLAAVLSMNAEHAQHRPGDGSGL